MINMTHRIGRHAAFVEAVYESEIPRLPINILSVDPVLMNISTGMVYLG